MESFVRINIAEQEAGGNYFYFFHVDVKHYPNSEVVQRVYKSLKANYPAPQYQIDVTYWKIGGCTVNMEE